MSKVKGDPGRDRELPETEWAELERLCKENAVYGWHVLLRRKLRPGSRNNSREVVAIADWASEKQ
jgi:hypothetical protein